MLDVMDNLPPVPVPTDPTPPGEVVFEVVLLSTFFNWSCVCFNNSVSRTTSFSTAALSDFMSDTCVMFSKSSNFDVRFVFFCCESISSARQFITMTS